MQAQRRTAQEQYQLILECRSNGLSDYQWCMEHDIKPGTFYNWVKRLRKKACYEISPAAGRGDYKAAPRQDVVKLEMIPDNSATVLHDPEGQILANTKIKRERSIASTCSSTPFSAIIVSHYTESKKLSTQLF